MGGAHERRSPAARNSALRSRVVWVHADFLGVFLGISDRIFSCLARYIARLLYVNCVAQTVLLCLTNSALHTPNIARAAVQRVHWNNVCSPNPNSSSPKTYGYNNYTVVAAVAC